MSPLAQDFQPKGSDLLNHVLVGIYNLHVGNGRKPLFLLLMGKIIQGKILGSNVLDARGPLHLRNVQPSTETAGKKCGKVHSPCLCFFTFNMKIEWGKR